MRFVLMHPSLEHRALFKIAVTLWNHNDVRALIAKLSFQWDSWITDEWEEIERKVTEEVAQLPLPQLLKDKVSCFIKPVGFQILEWIKFHHIRCDLPLSLPFELCWTPQGTVDRKGTAEVLVKDESLDIDTHCKLACVYCLEDDIIALLNSMPEDLRESFLSGYSPNIAEWDQKWIISFWSRSIKGRGLGNAPTSYKSGFERCARAGNKAAAEYFLQKLTPREREESVVEAAKYVTNADTLCLLLSEMDVEQQMEVFKNNPRRVLYCFLQWPWQSFFIEIANCMRDFLPKEDCECILRNIIYKVADGYMDWNYQNLFREFWQISPEALKSLIKNDLDKSDLLPSLCRMKDKEITRLIFQDATQTVKQKLVYSDKMNYFFQDCIRDDEWDSLEFCIRECFLSKDLMLKFKERFEKSIKWKNVRYKLVRNKDKWNKLFLSSDDSFCEYRKRSADEGESSSSKRFRSLQ